MTQEVLHQRLNNERRDREKDDSHHMVNLSFLWRARRLVCCLCKVSWEGRASRPSVYANDVSIAIKVNIGLFCDAFHGGFLLMSAALVVESEQRMWKLCVLMKNHKGEADGGRCRFPAGTAGGGKRLVCRWSRLSAELLPFAEIILLNFLFTCIPYKKKGEV